MCPKRLWPVCEALLLWKRCTFYIVSVLTQLHMSRFILRVWDLIWVSLKSSCWFMAEEDKINGCFKNNTSTVHQQYHVWQGIKTHLTVWPGGRRKFSIYNVLQEIPQDIYFFVYYALFSQFFMMKITYQIKQVTEHKLYLMYSFYEYCIQRTWDKWRTWFSFIPLDDFVHVFPT